VRELGDREREGKTAPVAVTVGLLAFVSFAPVVLAAPPVRLEIHGACPSEGRISAELEAIVSSREGAPEPVDVARITTQEGMLLVTLRGPDGAPLGERRIPAEGDCDAQARTVAVILATFLTDLHPEYLTLLPAAQPEAAPEAPPAEITPPAEAPPKAPLPAPVPPAQRSAPPSPDPRAEPVLAIPPTRDEWLLTAAAGVALSSKLVPAGEVSFSFVPGARGLGARVFVLVPGSADRELGGAVASFARYPLGVGPIVRAGGRGAWLDAGAGVALGWLRVAGRTFAINSSADDLVVGACSSVRAGTEWLGLRPFVELGALVWPGESVLISSTPAASTTLPRFEANFLLGAGLPL
jgi:hypothetical protein